MRDLENSTRQEAAAQSACERVELSTESVGTGSSPVNTARGAKRGGTCTTATSRSGPLEGAPTPHDAFRPPCEPGNHSFCRTAASDSPEFQCEKIPETDHTGQARHGGGGLLQSLGDRSLNSRRSAYRAGQRLARRSSTFKNCSAAGLANSRCRSKSRFTEGEDPAVRSDPAGSRR
jgi:hypothetical protein